MASTSCKQLLLASFLLVTGIALHTLVLGSTHTTTAHLVATASNTHDNTALPASYTTPALWANLSAVRATHGRGEGHVGEVPAQAVALHGLISALPSNSRILEIGFNCGHSSALMLATRPDVTIVSLDLGQHAYVEPAKALIDATFPSRHVLLLGDSKDVLPRVRGVFDMFGIDGGHKLPEASSDLHHCLALARPRDLVVMDDIVVADADQRSWTVHPSHVWSEAVAAGRLRHISYLGFGPGRGMAVGQAATPPRAP